MSNYGIRFSWIQEEHILYSIFIRNKLIILLSISRNQLKILMCLIGSCIFGEESILQSSMFKGTHDKLLRMNEILAPLYYL